MLQNYNVSNGTKLPAKITYCKYQSVDANPTGNPTVRVFIDGFSAGTMAPGESFEIPYTIGELRFETVDPDLRAIFRAGIVRVLSTVQTIDGVVEVSGTIEKSAADGMEYGTDMAPFAITLGLPNPKVVAVGIINQTSTPQKVRRLEMSNTLPMSFVDVVLSSFTSLNTGANNAFFSVVFNKLTGNDYFPGNGDFQNDVRPFSYNASYGDLSGLFTGIDQKGVFSYVGSSVANQKIEFESDGSVYVPPNHVLMIRGRCDASATAGTVYGSASWAKQT